MATYDVLLSDVSRLPVDERLQLIEAVWDSVPTEAVPPLSGEWLAEIRRRSDELDQASLTGVLSKGPL